MPHLIGYIEIKARIKKAKSIISAKVWTAELCIYCIDVLRYLMSLPFYQKDFFPLSYITK